MLLLWLLLLWLWLWLWLLRSRWLGGGRGEAIKLNERCRGGGRSDWWWL